jgi:hypothetical protein
MLIVLRGMQGHWTQTMNHAKREDLKRILNRALLLSRSTELLMDSKVKLLRLEIEKKEEALSVAIELLVFMGKSQINLMATIIIPAAE